MDHWASFFSRGGGRDLSEEHLRDSRQNFRESRAKELVCVSEKQVSSMLRIKNSKPLRSNGLHKRSPFQSAGKFFHGRSQQVEHVAKRGFVVCVICYTPYSYPVTFIRAHIQRLPAKVIVLYGRYFRAAGQDGEIVACTNGRYGRSLLPLAYRLSRKISRRFLRSGSGRFE